jgi:hypothetical protein
MRCEDVRGQLIDLATGHETPDEPQLRRHLDECEECHGEWQRTVQMWSLLTAIPGAEPDPAAMRHRFTGTLAAFQAMTAHDDGSFQSRVSPAWRPWPFVGATAAALMLLLGGAVIGRSLPVREESRDDLTVVQQELRDVREMLTLSLLQQPSASERLRGVSAAGRLSDPRADVVAALVDALLHDPNVNVRLACVRALGRFRDRAATREGVTTALVREQSPLVTTALISFVVDGRDSTAIETLRRLSEDPSRDAAMRDIAAEGIERLLEQGQL